MKTIQILGTGCAKCAKLADVAKVAADQVGAPYTLVKVTDIAEIMAMGAMMTPALAIDGEIKFAGKVPPVADIVALLS